MNYGRYIMDRPAFFRNDGRRFSKGDVSAMKVRHTRCIAALMAAVFFASSPVYSAEQVTNPMPTTANKPTELDDINSLSTRFDQGGALDGWQLHEVKGWVSKWEAPRIEAGHLILRPRSSGWFDDNQAGHLFRVVQGDFVVTTRLQVSGTHSSLPQTDFSLAGLFIRTPRELSDASQWAPGRENWLFFSVGTASPQGEPHYEIKTTTNSRSVLKILPSQAGWVELRIARTGEVFTLLHRPEGTEQWRVIDQMIRPDLPETLNVGVTAYSDYSSVWATDTYNTSGSLKQNADLIARVERINFRRPAAVGRLPIANLDAPTGGPLGKAIITRRDDFLSD
jgi:hypothetical protein